MTPAERNAREWFAEAERCHLERHQGCAWCGGAHCVFRRRDGHRLSYTCHRCDFRAVHDPAADAFSFIPGEDARATVPKTMFEL
jgi:hypothetical protein